MVGACVSIVKMRQWITTGSWSSRKPIRQVSLSLEEGTPKKVTWEVKVLQLQSPDGDSIEIKSNNLFAVSELLRKLM